MKKLVTIEDYQRRKSELEALLAISPYLEELFQIIRMAQTKRSVSSKSLYDLIYRRNKPSTYFPVG